MSLAILPVHLLDWPPTENVKSMQICPPTPTFSTVAIQINIYAVHEFHTFENLGTHNSSAVALISALGAQDQRQVYDDLRASRFMVRADNIWARNTYSKLRSS